jgi:hypothetical protein
MELGKNVAPRVPQQARSPQRIRSVADEGAVAPPESCNPRFLKFDWCELIRLPRRSAGGGECSLVAFWRTQIETRAGLKVIPPWYKNESRGRA